MTTTPSLVPDRLDDLVLARIATSRQPPSDAELARTLRPFAPKAYDDARWFAAIHDAVERLIAGDQLGADRRARGGAAVAARRLGVTGPLPWKRVLERIVPALALGVAADDARSHGRLKDRDQWAAATVARARGLWTDGPPPSLSALCDTIVWRALGLAGSAKRTPPEVRAHFVHQLLPEGSGSAARHVHLLAGKLADASRADLRALREALVRRWLCGQEWRGDVPRAAPRPNDFAIAVHDAAEHATDGLFGGRKVFISSVWRGMRAHPAFAAMTLDEFKQRLVAAHKAGLVSLVRADLTGAMDPAAVRESETTHLEARYHFVEKESRP